MTSLPITRRETSRVTPREGYRDTIPATQDESQRGTSQDLIGSQPDDLPSNQEMLNNEPSQTTTDLQEEFDSLDLPTKYLSPSGSRDTGMTLRMQLKSRKNFKKKYLEFTESLDQTTSHLESLSQPKSKGRTPTRLRITTKRWWSIARMRI